MSARLRSGTGSGGMWAMGRLGGAELELGGRLRVVCRASYPGVKFGR